MNKIDFTHTNIVESDKCKCCGNTTMLLTSDLQKDGNSYCEYSIRWTKDRIIDPWGVFLITFDGEKYIGITVEYRVNENAFMIVDSGRFNWPIEMLREDVHLAERDDLTLHPIAQWIFQVLDYIWANEKLPLNKTDSK